MGQNKIVFSEVFSFQMLKCMQEWYLGREKVEVSSIEGCSYREVQL